MSTVKTNTLTGTTTAGSISVTGEGNSTIKLRFQLLLRKLVTLIFIIYS